MEDTVEFRLQYHLTEKCGNRCRHCYETSWHRNCQLTNFQAIIDDLETFRQKWNFELQVTLIGGDPLLHPQFRECVEYLQTKKIKIFVAGNPETLTVKQADWLASRIHHFQFSLDGNEEMHDWFRYTGSFQVLMKKIKEIVAVKLRVNLMTTISSINLHLLPEIMRIAYDSGAACWAFARYTPTIGHPDNLTPEKYREMLLECNEKHKLYENQEILPQQKEPLLYLLRNPSPPKINRTYQQINGCGMCGPILAILPDNSVMACRRHAGSRIGSWQGQGDLAKLFFASESMRKLRQVELIDKCGQCPYLCYCRGCRAIAFSVRGQLLDCDPQCWL